MILRAGAFTLAAAGADYCNSVQYLVNWNSVQGAPGCEKKDARQAARLSTLLLNQEKTYQFSFRVYLPLVEPVPPL